jgi:hypothetical protein
MQSQSLFVTGDFEAEKRGWHREGDEGRQNSARERAAGSFASGVKWVGRVGATEQRFLISRATQQLEEIVGLETKSPATCGALFFRHPKKSHR